MLRSLAVLLVPLFLLGATLAGGAVPASAADRREAASSVKEGWMPPAAVLDEIERTFETGARAGKGGWRKTLPPRLFNSPTVDAAYATFAAYRNGDRQDVIVSKAACFAITQTLAGTSSPDEQDWEGQMYVLLPDSFSPGVPGLVAPGPYNWLIKNQVTRYANTLTVLAISPPALRRYYLDYCF